MEHSGQSGMAGHKCLFGPLITVNNSFMIQEIQRNSTVHLFYFVMSTKEPSTNCSWVNIPSTAWNFCWRSLRRWPVLPSVPAQSYPILHLIMGITTSILSEGKNINGMLAVVDINYIVSAFGGFLYGYLKDWQGRCYDLRGALTRKKNDYLSKTGHRAWWENKELMGTRELKQAQGPKFHLETHEKKKNLDTVMGIPSLEMRSQLEALCSTSLPRE